MDAPASANELARKLGHDFKHPELLEQALTHISVAEASYERLEFLGDRVLGLAIAEILLHRFPDEDEGLLTRRLAAAVRAETLTRVARRLDLGQYLRVSKGEDAAGTRANAGILADVCEAVIAALYLDDGLEAARRFIASAWMDILEETPSAPKDAKTELQEWAQARALPVPAYREIAREGPDHAPTFTVEVEVAGSPPVRAQGPSKRIAEQRAAQTLLSKAKNVRFD
jgi:ribonuclease-3